MTAYGYDYREYAEVLLNSALLPGVCYHIEMYINLANRSKYTTDSIGIYFSDTLITGINNYFPLPFTPQINIKIDSLIDTLSWTLISGNYTALGGENYLIFGSFLDDANTDTVLFNSNGFLDVIYFYIDDVCLTQCGGSCSTGTDEQIEKKEIEIYPDPLANKLNVTVNNNELSEIILYDIASRKLLQQKFTHTVTLNTAQLAKGMYVYEVRNEKGVVRKGKVILR